SWVDEILHTAQLSPFKRGADLERDEVQRLRESIVDVLGRAIEHYEAALALPIPDKLPMPLTVHRRNGEPCPRCGDRLEAVFYEDYVMCYCPTCQTEGKLLKDRRLSRLLKSRWPGPTGLTSSSPVADRRARIEAWLHPAIRLPTSPFPTRTEARSPC